MSGSRGDEDALDREVEAVEKANRSRGSPASQSPAASDRDLASWVGNEVQRRNTSPMNMMASKRTPPSSSASPGRSDRGAFAFRNGGDPSPGQTQLSMLQRTSGALQLAGRVAAGDSASPSSAASRSPQRGVSTFSFSGDRKPRISKSSSIPPQLYTKKGAPKFQRSGSVRYISSHTRSPKASLMSPTSEYDPGTMPLDYKSPTRSGLVKTMSWKQPERKMTRTPTVTREQEWEHTEKNTCMTEIDRFEKGPLAAHNRENFLKTGAK